MSETKAMYRTAASCRAWEAGDDLDIWAETARYAAELRAARGIPSDRGGEPWDEAMRRPAYDPDGETQDDLHQDWSAADRQALAELQAAVRDVLIDYHDGDDLDWIVEETLWQIRQRLKRDGSVRLPMTAILARAQDGRVYGAGVDGVDPMEASQ